MADRFTDRWRDERRDDEERRYRRSGEREIDADYERGLYRREDYSSGYSEPEWGYGYRREGAPITQDFGHGRAGYTGSSTTPYWATREYTQGATSRRYREPRGRGEYSRGPEYGRRESEFTGRGDDYGREGSYREPHRRRDEYGREWGDREGEDRGFFDRAADEVRAWFGDDEAERRRRMDEQRYGGSRRESSARTDGEHSGALREGWRATGPYAGRGPKGYQRSDERIREDVCDRLTEYGGIDASEIEITVSNGEVTLQGTVENRQAKHLAEDLVDNISGVKDVHNQLRVNHQIEIQTSEQPTKSEQRPQQGQPRTKSASS